MKKTRLLNQDFDFVLWIFSQEIQTHLFSEVERAVFLEAKAKIKIAYFKFENGEKAKKTVSFSYSQSILLKKIIQILLPDLDGIDLALASKIILQQ